MPPLNKINTRCLLSEVLILDLFKGDRRPADRIITHKSYCILVNLLKGLVYVIAASTQLSRN